MIYKLYTGGKPILAVVEFLCSLLIPALILGGIIELFGLSDTIIGQNKELSLILGAAGYFVCLFLYQYIVYKVFLKIRKEK